MKLVERFELFKREKEAYQELFRELEKGQKPWAMVISCCDSRIVPELIFKADPGEIFVLRNVANVVPPYGIFPSVDAAVEYAVEHLKVQELAVLGHSQCGGVKAMVEGTLETGGLFKWLESRARQIGGICCTKSAEKLNVKLSIENLLKYPCVEKAVSEGTLKIVGLYYDFANFTLELIE